MQFVLERNHSAIQVRMEDVTDFLFQKYPGNPSHSNALLLDTRGKSKY